jgi:hypothetical protein
MIIVCFGLNCRSRASAHLRREIQEAPKSGLPNRNNALHIPQYAASKKFPENEEPKPEKK